MRRPQNLKKYSNFFKTFTELRQNKSETFSIFYGFFRKPGLFLNVAGCSISGFWSTGAKKFDLQVDLLSFVFWKYWRHQKVLYQWDSGLEKYSKCLTNCHLMVSPMQISTLNKIAQPFFHLQKVWIIIRIKSIMAILAICVNFHFGSVNFNS